MWAPSIYPKTWPGSDGAKDTTASRCEWATAGTGADFKIAHQEVNKNRVVPERAVQKDGENAARKKSLGCEWKRAIRDGQKSGNTRKAENRRTGCAQTEKSGGKRVPPQKERTAEASSRAFKVYFAHTTRGLYCSPYPSKPSAIHLFCKNRWINASVSYQPDPAGKLR